MQPEKRTYGLSQPFITSGDLRVALAMTPPGSEGHKLLEEHLKTDPFIYTGSDSKTIFYREEALAEQEQYLDNLRSIPPILFNRFGHPVHMQGNWHKGTCILVGSGPGVELEAVVAAQKEGVAVITLGNACFLYKDSDLWIGNGQMTNYAYQGLESPRTLALVPAQRKEDNLWDLNRQEFLQAKVSDMPNILYYDTSPRTPKTFFDNPCVTGFGLNSSLPVGLTMAALFGFTNILMTGIDLGGNIDKFYAFPEIPHKETFERKMATYRQVAGFVAQIIKEFHKRALRLYSVGHTAFGVPAFPAHMVGSLFTGLMPRSKQTRSLRGISIPDHAQVHLRDVMRRHQQATLGIHHMFDREQAVVDRAPNAMNTEDTRKTLSALDAALKAGGCTSCAKKSHIRPIYTLFVQQAVAGNEEVVKAWKDMFPDSYIIMHNGKMHFRPDKAHLEEELNKLVPAT